MKQSEEWISSVLLQDRAYACTRYIQFRSVQNLEFAVPTINLEPLRQDMLQIWLVLVDGILH